MFSVPESIKAYRFPEALKKMQKGQAGVSPLKARARVPRIIDLSIFEAIVWPIFFET
jgi:hypothetical protein